MKSELRHVDDMNSPTEIRRFSQSAEFVKRNKEIENESSSDIIENKDVIIQESTEELKALKVLDETLHEGTTTHERIRSVSKNMIIDLIPGKVKLDQSDKQMKGEAKDKLKLGKNVQSSGTVKVKEKNQAKNLMDSFC